MDILYLAILALIVAVMAGLFGFSGMSRRGTSAGQILFMLLLVLAGFLFLFSRRGIFLP